MNSKKTTRILVTGSREWDDHWITRDALLFAEKLLPAERYVLRNGDGKGLDKIAAKQAGIIGHSVILHPANWKSHTEHCPDWDKENDMCKLAGLRRNTEMLAEQNDIVLAFPMHPKSAKTGSRGTWDTVRRADKTGLPVFVIWENNLWPYNALAETLLTDFVKKHALEENMSTI